MDSQSRSLLPRHVLAVFVGVTVVVAIAALAIGSHFGWAPPRESATAILPIYFGVLLAVLTLSFVISGNTLMHHHRTGTVQRSTDPVWFWRIVVVQSLIAVVLLVIGCVQWGKLHG